MANCWEKLYPKVSLKIFAGVDLYTNFSIHLDSDEIAANSEQIRFSFYPVNCLVVSQTGFVTPSRADRWILIELSGTY